MDTLTTTACDCITEWLTKEPVGYIPDSFVPPGNEKDALFAESQLRVDWRFNQFAKFSYKCRITGTDALCDFARQERIWLRTRLQEWEMRAYGHLILPPEKLVILPSLPEGYSSKQIVKSIEKPLDSARIPEAIEEHLQDSTGFVYILSDQLGHYKIGKAKDVGKRLTQIGILFLYPLLLIHTFPAKNYHRAEAALHSQFAKFRMNGEWFKLDGNALEWIKKIESM